MNCSSIISKVWMMIGKVKIRKLSPNEKPLTLEAAEEKKEGGHRAEAIKKCTMAWCLLCCCLKLLLCYVKVIIETFQIDLMGEKYPHPQLRKGENNGEKQSNSCGKLMLSRRLYCPLMTPL